MKDTTRNTKWLLRGVGIFAFTPLLLAIFFPSAKTIISGVGYSILGIYMINASLDKTIWGS